MSHNDRRLIRQTIKNGEMEAIKFKATQEVRKKIEFMTDIMFKKKLMKLVYSKSLRSIAQSPTFDKS